MEQMRLLGRLLVVLADTLVLVLLLQVLDHEMNHPPGCIWKIRLRTSTMARMNKHRPVNGFYYPFFVRKKTCIFLISNNGFINNVFVAFFRLDEH